jgi:hypothetical protein
MDSATESTALSNAPNEELSPLEQDVLDEYERLAENMKKVLLPPFIRLFSWMPQTCAYGIDIASESTGRYGRTPDGRDTGWVEAVGKEDELGVYAVEGECV